MPAIKPGKYQHHKGKHYEVIGTACHSETLEAMVIYRALYRSKRFGKNALWARPKKMFLEKVKVGDKKVPRFKRMVKQDAKQELSKMKKNLKQAKNLSPKFYSAAEMDRYLDSV